MNHRLEFIESSFQKDVSFMELCKNYGISTNTGYNWKEMFYEKGISGLYDQSRKPLNSPKQLPEDTIYELIRIKQIKKNWGPNKIQAIYASNHKDEKVPSHSTVERIQNRKNVNL